MPDVTDDELKVVTAYAIYQWDCPYCGNLNAEDFDPQGEEVQCGDCDEPFLVEYTE